MIVKQVDFTFSEIEKTWGWKIKIGKWNGFHQQHHLCSSASQPKKLNPNKVNVSNPSRWNSRGTLWKDFYDFYKIQLMSLKVLKIHLDISYGPSNVHSYKKI